MLCWHARCEYEQWNESELEENMNRIVLIALILAVVPLMVGCEEDNNILVPDNPIPQAPVGVFSVTGDEYVDVYWQANNDGITEGYGVYRYVGQVGELDEYVLIGTVDAISGIDIQTFRDHDLDNGSTYWYSVNAYNGFGESELSYEDAQDTPRPQGNKTLRDFHVFPEDAGFDFSAARVRDWEDDRTDVFFEYDPDLEEFFFFAGNDGVDIQDWGYIEDIHGIGWGDPGDGEGWSRVGWMELVEGHGYIVWTADDHFAGFRVNTLNDGSLSIQITWSYQTDQGNPELKLVVIERPEHDENYGKRERN